MARYARLRWRVASFTLGGMKALWLLISTLLGVASPDVALAQVVAPIPITGPAQSAMQQLHPPAPLEQVRELATRRPSPLPPPSPPVERWVPERQVYAPEFGRTLVIPGHYERRVSDQLYSVPTLPAYEVRNGIPIIIPGGDRPPVDLRQGP
jgi:hypothetical protein